MAVQYWIGVVLSIAVMSGCNRGPDPYATWAMYEGDAGASHFSSLSQINKSNVHNLEVAWTYPIEDNSASGMSPLIVDRTLFAVGTDGAVIALDAATGEELWKHLFPRSRTRDRGILYWESEDRSDRRVYVPRGHHLYAIDAMTGEGISSFGIDGRTDVRQGIARDTSMIRATPSSPGTVFENLIILGSGPGENYGSGPGDIRAFDARTGELAWVFHTIPHPGEFGYDTWEDPEAWKTAGAVNAWGGISVDDERGIVYIPLGSASYDFYGVDRPGANLFANSIVALNARTGERIWHFQTIHHDLWDYDLAATPTLLTVRHEGKKVDAVAVAAKTGFLFVFDRVTGEPLWEIEERPMLASGMPGEKAWPTQPFPTHPKPFAVQKFTEEDVNPYLPQEEQDSLRRYVASMKNMGLFTPPDTIPTMQMPGNSGGANWGSTAADPKAGLFYVLTKNEPTVLKLEKVVPGVPSPGAFPTEIGYYVYQQNCRLCHLPSREGQPPLIPPLTTVFDRLSDDEVRAVVRQGRATMPGFIDLSDDEINAIITYLKYPEFAPAEEDSVDLASGEERPLRYKTGYGYFTSSLGWAIKPPWMTMTAYDLNTGDILWQIPVGDADSLVARGITGTGAVQLRGGPAVTAGGLIFMAAQKKLRVYDQDTGVEICSIALPAEIEGVPAVYEVDGRQFVAFGAGGGGFGAQAPGASRSYVAFALPVRE